MSGQTTVSKQRPPARTKRAPRAAGKSAVPVAALPVPASPRGKAAAKATKPAQTEKPPKVEKVEKKTAKPPRQVRDGFTMPESDFALIAVLKTRALSSRRAAKKSELLRAGLHALAALDAKALVASLDRLEPVKIGRPKKGH